MNGFLIINKPAGLTSHDVVNYVRRILKVGLPAEALAQVGHAGTLDPFATGVLIVAIGKGTRLLEYTKNWSKTYQAEITLGATSDTDDVTGKITPYTTLSSRQLAGGPPPPSQGGENFLPLMKGESRAQRGVGVASREQILETLQSFLGPIQQIPPAYAAIKVKGKKLYEYARAGETVERSPRQIIIHTLKVLSYEYPRLKLEIHCGAGTYVRALGRDIGEKLGTGGYVSHLERKSVHKFHISAAIALDKLSTENLTAHLLPLEKLTEQLPRATLSPDNVVKWRQGKAVETKQKIPAHKPIATFDENQHLIGISHFDSTTHLLHPKKVL